MGTPDEVFERIKAVVDSHRARLQPPASGPQPVQPSAG
jgi:hypothetical protein